MNEISTRTLRGILDKYTDEIVYYFEDFFPSRFYGKYIDLLPSRDDVIQFNITRLGEEQRWQATQIGGVIQTTRNTHLEPRCTYKLDQSTFLAIVGGALSPQRAFFAGRLKIEGDIIYALRLGAVLEQFFYRHPFRESGMNS